MLGKRISPSLDKSIGEISLAMPSTLAKLKFSESSWITKKLKILTSPENSIALMSCKMILSNLRVAAFFEKPKGIYCNIAENFQKKITITNAYSLYKNSGGFL